MTAISPQSVLHGKARVSGLIELMTLQVFASTPGEGSAGVYWMYYAGSNFEEAAAPRGLPGLQGQSPAEGLR